MLVQSVVLRRRVVELRNREGLRFELLERSARSNRRPRRHRIPRNAAGLWKFLNEKKPYGKIALKRKNGNPHTPEKTVLTAK